MNIQFSGLFLNYLKVGLRSLNRYRQYSMINLLGLVIGLSSVIAIGVYIYEEICVDRHHENGAEIYRINIQYIRPNRVTQYPLIPPAFGPAILDNFPEIVQGARLRYAYDALMHNEHLDKSFYEEGIFFAESDFLKMFSFLTLRGDPVKALQTPNTLVMTRSMARKYFGDQNPIGQSIRYNDELVLNVGAVIDDVPQNTHFTFDFLISFVTFKPGPGSLADMTSWRWLGFLTYVQVTDHAAIDHLEKKLAELFVANRPPNPSSKVKVDLQPLFDIYLKSSEISNPMGGLFKLNSLNNILSLGIVAVLIIVIAFFNYLNIVTALMQTRTKEMGIRKLLGTSRRKIVGQLMTETAVLMGITGLLSVGVLTIVYQSGYLAKLNGASLLFVFILVLVFGLLFSLICGLYLGAVLSSYPIISLLQNKLGVRTSKFSFKHVVLFTQYAISASLIAISLIVIAQIKYVNLKQLGFEKTGVLALPFRGSQAGDHVELLRNELLKNPVVTGVTFGPPMDGSSSGSPLRLKEWPENQTVQTAYFGVDFDFTSFMDLQLKAGRFFDASIQSDSTEALLINETLAKALELEDPINAPVIFAGGRPYRIIGVFSDFHYQSLHHEIGPMGLLVSFVEPRNMLIRFETDQIHAAISSIEESWNSIFPNYEYPFQYRFLDDQLASLYTTEKKFSQLIQIFTGLAIFIALLGLYGLSSITIHLKIKQISIRRVLGARIGDISRIIGLNFLLTSLIASLVSWPLVHYLMDIWLSDFAYKVELGITFLFQMLGFVLLVTIVTLAVQVRRVLTTNPAIILKND